MAKCRHSPSDQMARDSSRNTARPNRPPATARGTRQLKVYMASRMSRVAARHPPVNIARVADRFMRSMMSDSRALRISGEQPSRVRDYDRRDRGEDHMLRLMLFALLAG